MTSQVISERANEILKRAQEKHEQDMAEMKRKAEIKAQQAALAAQIGAIEQATRELEKTTVDEIRKSNNILVKQLKEEKSNLEEKNPWLANAAHEAAQKAQELAEKGRKQTLGTFGQLLRKISDASKVIVDDVKTGYNS